MWLEKLLKKQFISFYKEENYKCISMHLSDSKKQKNPTNRRKKL